MSKDVLPFGNLKAYLIKRNEEQATLNAATQKAALECEGRRMRLTPLTYRRQAFTIKYK